MKNIIKFTLIALIMAITVSSCKKDKGYETVKNDPLKARIYTLDNGLKVYMSVNKDEPRIQTYIAVKVGSKNDPAETTGLAHYFEHLMFKGTSNFGTTNYELEKPLLDQIEALFEVYRKTTDSIERKNIYKQIDSLSYEASKISIPNEYDKLMAAIGATGTNAYTSFDVTCYTENIPSNEIENWAKIQADRFKNNVIRGFHTELETVYEEYNMSLTRDSWTTYDTLLSALFPHHPYGTQTTLGTQAHLKNPSITNIKNYYKTYYVPNNMAICLSGDFDPDQMIEVIKKYFGDMEPNNNLPKLQFEPETAINQPIIKEVVGLEAANLSLGWRIDKASSQESLIATLASLIMYNGNAGLIDLNLIQKQKILEAYCYSEALADYGIFTIDATPKEGQTLEEAKDLLLAQVAKLRTGDFDETLLKATIENQKLMYEQYYDNNYGRANAFVNSFINDIPWNDNVQKLDKLSKITKEDIVKFANEKLGANSYVAVFKREGTPNHKKIEKPTITPIFTNRDTTSNFLKEIQNNPVEPIEPVFINFEQDMQKSTAKSNIPVLYKKNETTQIFNLYYVFETGAYNDATLYQAFNYLRYLGTSTKTPEQIKQEFYNLACSFDMSVGGERSYIILSGLSENMPKAMSLLEELLNDPQPNDTILENLKNDILKNRSDNKLNQSYNFGRLRNYVTYGPESIKKTTLPNEAIKALKSEDLLAQIKMLLQKEHTIMYYGPKECKELVSNINQYHQTPETLSPITNIVHFSPLTTTEPTVYLAQYDAKQIYYAQYANRGIAFDVNFDSDIALYNEYFGGGMSSIVFQEMREARGLAYSANAFFAEPYKAQDSYYFMAFIATQNDKMKDAMKAFSEIIENMPESEPAFNIAKESILSRLRTERTIKEEILWAYMDANDMGVNYDRHKAIYEKIQKMTLADVKSFQEKHVKGNIYNYCILGDIKDLDLKSLEAIGKVKTLSQTEIFGY